MALPFIAGLAVGAGISLLYSKRDEVKKALDSKAFKDNVKKGKELSNKALKGIKDTFNEVSPKIKKSAKSAFKSLKSNLESAKLSSTKNATKSTAKSATKKSTKRSSAKKTKIVKVPAKPTTQSVVAPLTDSKL